MLSTRFTGEDDVSSVIYVVPWAICDTENMYIKKVDKEAVPSLEKGMPVDDDWCIRNIIANPDRRSKDVYAIVDVYNSCGDKTKEKDMTMYFLNNSVELLEEKGYVRATDLEREYINARVLRLNKKTGK